MARNQKLTHTLQGRSFNAVRREDQNLVFDLNDGSTMWVKTVMSQTPLPEIKTGDLVHAVRQQNTDFTLDFESGASLSLQTAEATSCVLVRGKDHALEYAD